jgi:hypothetical protein
MRWARTGCDTSHMIMTMKKMLDPKNILNPNKIFAADKLALA